MKSKDQVLLEEAYQSIIEQVGGNYLYHSTPTADIAKQILSSGYFKAVASPQMATLAQTNLPTVSFGRDLTYQMSGASVGRDYEVVFVVDRGALESKYRTLATSQSWEARGTAFADRWALSRVRVYKHHVSLYDINKNNKLDPEEISKAPKDTHELLNSFYKSKAGKEFEEVVPTKTGKIPWKGMLVGFYVIPGKEAAKDEELLNHPLRLEMPRPNVFVKAN